MAESSRSWNQPEAMSVTSGSILPMGNNKSFHQSFHERQISSDEGDLKEKFDFDLKLANKCIEEVHGLPAQKFNNEQCGYLVSKLEVTVKIASLFPKCSQEEPRGPHISMHIARQSKNFELLVALAMHIENFVRGCSKDTWMQSALTLANSAEYVSSLGFNLELCKIALSNGQATSRSLTMNDVCKINKDEVKIVKEKALQDEKSLLKNVAQELKSSNCKDCDLATYLVHRILVVQPKSTFDGDNIFMRLFERVVLGKKKKRLGKGASASVYKGLWLGIPVAQKTFKGPENKEFLMEVEILSQLSHPNITSMFCCHMNKRSCSIIMELMDGDLCDLIESRLDSNYGGPPFTMLEGIDLMLQVGEGVNYLHDKRIVHRDLKSSNILVKNVEVSGLELKYVQAKVVDFGLSKTKENSTYSNMTFNTGTSRWMAPEVMNNTKGHEESFGSSEKLLKHVFKIDIYSFAMVCYEILTGEEPFISERSLCEIRRMVLEGERPKIPDYCPLMLKSLIEKCWSQIPTERPHIGDVCMQLKYIKYLLLTNSEDLMTSSQSMETNIMQTKTECGREEVASISSSAGLEPKSIKESSIQQNFVVHQLHPQLSDIPTSAPATLIFFHGFHKAPKEWRGTWMTRDNKLVWPQEWLPEDLGAEYIRVLSVAFDETTTMSNWHEIGKNLINSLVLSLEWKLGESGEAIFLIGHSFGGVLIKTLVTKARHVVQNNKGQQEAMKCKTFLERLAKIVFYSVPHAEFENYISECRKIVALRESFFLQSLEEDTQFVADMNKLSSEFENVVPEKLQILAFLEGKAMSKELCVLVTEKSCEGAWEWLKIDEDNHFEVCRPNSKNHTGYRILLEHLYQHLNDPYGVTTLDSDITRVLGKRQSDDLSKASEALLAKSFSFRAEGSSGSAIFFATPEHSTLPDIDSNKPSDRSRGASRWTVIDESTRLGKEDLSELPESLDVEAMGPSSDGDHYWEPELEPKHNIFLSHSEAQKDFTEQLCVDLERQQYYPFFAKRKIPAGREFREIIVRVAYQCNVAVLILSEDFFTHSKWPMIELELIVEVQKKNSKKLSILPVYLEVSRDECTKNEAKRSYWLSVWRKWAQIDDRIDVDKWEEAFRVLGLLNGIQYVKSLGEVMLREKIVSAIEYLVSLHIQGSSRICKEPELEPEHQIFLSYSGAQTDFTEQLCVDLERQQYYPFLGKRKIPAGREFPEFIFRAAHQCKVAVLILSEEFFTRSKWPMIELELFVEIQKKNSKKLSILPVYLEISRDECTKNEARRSHWLSVWRKWAQIDDRIDVDKWKEALRVLGPSTGIEYVKSLGEVMLREKIVSAIGILVPP